MTALLDRSNPDSVWILVLRRDQSERSSRLARKRGGLVTIAILCSRHASATVQSIDKPVAN